MASYSFFAHEDIEVTFAGDAEQIFVTDPNASVIDVGSDDTNDPYSPVNMPLGPKSGGGRAVCVVVNGLGESPVIADEGRFQRAVTERAMLSSDGIVPVNGATAQQFGLTAGPQSAM